MATTYNSDEVTLLKEINAHIVASQEQMKDGEKRCTAILGLDQPVAEYTPFVISFVGRFKTGKSSLINALLGADILPTQATTATTVITRIVYGPVACAYLREQGELRTISIEEAKNIILNHKITEVDKTPEVVFELPVDWLKGNIELRDTPGMNDSAQNGLLEEIALNALTDSDLCVFVYDAGQFISGRERELTKQVQARLGGNIVFAINRTNMLNSVEGLNQVEKTARTVLEGLGNELVGNSRYYLMCSAPGMIDLDGFDVWLKDLLKANYTEKLNSLRKCAVSAGIGEVYEDVRGDLVALVQETTTLSDKLNAEHNRRIQKKKNEIANEARDKKAKVKADRLRVEERLGNTSGLEAYLKEKRSSSMDSYATFSKNAVRTFYADRTTDAMTTYCPYMKTYGNGFIDSAINGLSFPDVHKTETAATGGEVGTGAVIGGIIGSIFTFGLGTAIGAAIGAAIGGSSNTVDNSETNTVSFVERNVLSALKTGLANVFNREHQRIDSEAAQASAACKSGLEGQIEALRKLTRDLNARLSSEQMKRMAAYAKY